ncbi:MAG TPA: UDP-N-acetylglucosamine 1-carboxyvinyltransferase [Dehalococcoidia bacterium]|nr:UDP-N-acetylglucosamine 1-carboxyvinyltransferase [Dehalococcoidia bacterium]
MRGAVTTRSTSSFVIEGGTPLRGDVHVSGAKNAVLPALAATLLTDEECIIENVPDIGDVGVMTAIIQSVGAEVDANDPACLRVVVPRVTQLGPPSELVVNIRASFLTMGALLGRLGEASCCFPGGDVVGQRPIDTHLAGFQMLGATVGRDGERFTARTTGLRGARIFMDYPSVLGTENVMLAATLARGHTTIINAAAEPEVVFLARMLNSMGASIHGAGTHTIDIEGVERLHGCHLSVIPDRIEAGTFLVAAAATGGDVVVRGAKPRDMDATLAKLAEAGVTIEELPDGVRARRERELHAIHLQALPYPGLPTDMQAPMAALLTQAEGTSQIHERVFDNRLLYVDELRKMGAEIITSGGTTAIVLQRTPLVGATVRALDVRAGAALVLAGLVAEGSTTILDVYHLDRGYAALDEKLRGLGARIERREGAVVEPALS